MSAFVLGIGVAQPPGSISQEDAAAMAVNRCCSDERQARVLETLYRRAAVERRGCCLVESNDEAAAGSYGLDWFYPEETEADRDGIARRRGPTTETRMRAYRRCAPPLAVACAADALADGGIEASRVTHLVVATCTGFAAPGVEAAIVRGIGLPLSVERVHVGFMGCHAALNALQVAVAIATARPEARVLICCVEICSLHFQYGWHAERLVSNALFGDGAGAMVVGHLDDPPPHAWRVAGSASRLIEGTEDQMSWHIGDYGFVMSLSPRVPQTIAEHLRPWLDDWLARFDLEPDGIGAWAIHAGGPRIVEAVAERLMLAPSAVEPSRDVLRRHGNMSSATVVHILRSLRDRGAPTPCVALSFGPGLVAEASLLTGPGSGQGAGST